MPSFILDTLSLSAWEYKKPLSKRVTCLNPLSDTRGRPSLSRPEKVVFVFCLYSQGETGSCFKLAKKRFLQVMLLRTCTSKNRVWWTGDVTERPALPFRIFNIPGIHRLHLCRVWAPACSVLGTVWASWSVAIATCSLKGSASLRFPELLIGYHGF